MRDTEMTRQEIQSKLTTSFASRGITVTPPAIVILVVAVDAIEVDRHPDWPTTYDANALQEDAVDDEIVEVVRLARRIARRRKVELKEVKVTTFDILHNVSGWIDRVCLF